MTELNRRTVLGSIGAVAVGPMIGHLPGSRLPSSAAVVAALPTIPAVQSWTPGAGTFRFTSTTRLIVDITTASGLGTTAATFSDDLVEVCGRRLSPVQLAAPAAGDIFVSLSTADTGLGPEGYRMTIGDTIRIEARTARGAFYGTRTALQLLRTSSTVAAGTIRDWPRYAERGLLIANENKQFSSRWWQDQIRELAFLKLNLLWLYVGYPKAPAGEMAAVAEFARRYHVTVVPQFNMPGHLDGVPGRPYLKGNPARGIPDRPQSLDLSIQAGYDWADAKLSQLVPAIESPYWHTGADEYMIGARYEDYPQLATYARQHYGPSASARDTVYGFINLVNDTVRAQGRTLRIWNDGIHPNAVVPIATNVQIEHWLDSGRSAADLLAAGYQLQNCHLKQLYYDVGGVNAFEPAVVYDQFKVGTFHGSSVPDDHPGLLGAKGHVWIGVGTTVGEAEIGRSIAPSLRSLAQVTWGSPKPAPRYVDFAPLAGRVGHAPGSGFWLSDAAGLPGRAFVKPDEQHVLAAAGPVGGVLHWRYRESLVAERWPGPVVTGQPVGYRHGEEHHVFARLTDDSLAHWTGGPGQLDELPHLDSWGTVAGSVLSDPAGCAYSDQQHVFYRGSTGALEHRFRDRSSGTVVSESWGGELTGAPIVITFLDELHVVGAGPDGAVRHWWYTPRQTTSPQRETWGAGAAVASGLAGYAIGDQLHVYFRSPAGHLMHYFHDRSDNRLLQQDWGGELTGDPVAYTFGAEQHVFGRGPDDSLRHWFSTPGMPQPPARDTWTTPGVVTSGPAGYAVGNQQHVYFRANDGRLGHRFWDSVGRRIVVDDWPGAIPV
ncbi:glycoside hydrolase family 20 zincin-like fold domain-containing protein [Kribbella italica]|uniref:Hexosaminidase n=1 Tax=Kribbella italica TaxID=1540520 RepID=A0A7W9MTN1_9ACTN|nr:glycoside hydrolase family 20 zincin-like fold domain-containing protein [Kribbella italica]MBB5835859.1 hexosaminidase [Kribbella italica]